jgi:hypothetical protein
MKKIISVTVFILLFMNIYAQKTEIPAMKPEQTEDWSRIPKLVTPGRHNQIHPNGWREMENLSDG